LTKLLDCKFSKGNQPDNTEFRRNNRSKKVPATKIELKTLRQQKQPIRQSG